jgi:rhodanese-related sulfurtransferase
MKLFLPRFSASIKSFGTGHAVSCPQCQRRVAPSAAESQAIFLISIQNDVTLRIVSATRTIDPNITMADLLRDYPGAQRALFQAYHIGGCSSCGFSPDETLIALCQRNENLPVEEVIDTILEAHEADQALQISPADLSERLKKGDALALVDVRSREEWDAVHLPESKFLTQELMQEILSQWPKDKEIVFICHHGMRSLDAAAFFAGHGFHKAKSMKGGIDAWSTEVDPNVARYHVE